MLLQIMQYYQFLKSDYISENVIYFLPDLPFSHNNDMKNDLPLVKYIWQLNNWNKIPTQSSKDI